MVDYVLVVCSDGREDYLERTVESFERMVKPAPKAQIIVSDNPDPVWRYHLQDRFADRFEIMHAGRKGGFASVVGRMWRAAWGRAEFVFHLEDDFVFNEPVDVGVLAGLLDAHSDVAQVSLMRQPWNSTEREVGSVAGVWGDRFVERETGGVVWCEQDVYFTTNPSLYRGSLVERGWPQCAHSEGVLTHELLGEGYRFGVLGGRDAAPVVTHIGVERAGTGY